jgi:hypothetical protein
LVRSQQPPFLLLACLLFTAPPGKWLPATLGSAGVTPLAKPTFPRSSITAAS